MAKLVKMNWQQILQNVGGLIKHGGPLYPEPVWYQAALAVPPQKERARRPTRPPHIVLPEDEHVQKFHKIFPEEQAASSSEASTTYHVPPARIFAHRILELTKKNVSMQEAYKIATGEHELRKELMDPASRRRLLERRDQAKAQFEESEGRGTQTPR